MNEEKREEPQAMTLGQGPLRLEDLMRGNAKAKEIEAEQLRAAADEIERARLSGATLDVLRGMFWRSH